MKSFNLETLPKEGTERQEVLAPEMPEHPSVYVRNENGFKRQISSVKELFGRVD